MKTAEELNALKEEVETVSKKLHELSEEELTQVSGGGNVNEAYSEIWYNIFHNLFSWPRGSIEPDSDGKPHQEQG